MHARSHFISQLLLLCPARLCLFFSHGQTTLVSIPHANGEIGAIQPISAAAKIIRTHAPGALLHIDCSQSLGKTDVSAEELTVDFITIAGHKIYAPKGVGALYVRDRRLLPLLHGGGQQDNYRGVGKGDLFVCRSALLQLSRGFF
eukprot:XP_028343249.1 uncharacterized protein LOC114485649 [Physeter catodon]